MTPSLDLAARTLVAALALVLAACAQTGGATATGSPGDKRMSVIKGTATGITLLPAREARPPAAPAPAAPSTGHATAAPAAAAAPGPSASGAGGALSSLLQNLPPPTGRPLTEQKKLNEPGQGIPLPTAGSR